MGLEDLLARGRQTLADERAAEEARKAALAEKQRQEAVQAWQRCWKACADAIDPNLVEYLAEEMPDNFHAGWSAVRLEIRIPNLAPLAVEMVVPMDYTPGLVWVPSRYAGDPEGVMYSVAAYSAGEAEWVWGFESRYADLAKALAVAEERFRWAREGKSDPRAEIPF